MNNNAGGAAQGELRQARALMETAMSPLARQVEAVLQTELDALNTISTTAARQRITALFDRAPDVSPGSGMAREIVRAGGDRLVTFLISQLGRERPDIVAALDAYVGASERFLEPVLLRHAT